MPWRSKRNEIQDCLKFNKMFSMPSMLTKKRIVIGVVSCIMYFSIFLHAFAVDQSRLYKNVLRVCVPVEKPLAQRLHDHCQLSQP